MREPEGKETRPTLALHAESPLETKAGRGRAGEYGYYVSNRGPPRPQYQPRCPVHGRTLLWRNTRRPDDQEGAERWHSEWYCATPDYNPETGRNSCSFEIEDEILRAQVPGLISGGREAGTILRLWAIRRHDKGIN